MSKLNLALIVALAGAAGPAAAAADEDQQRADMQRALNAQVMSQPFDPGDMAKANAYAAEAKKANTPPVMQPPAYWVPGWTCASLSGYQYYQYNDYRNCVYYHYYYHRYW
ncbi:MAG: hypothetical protein ABW032_04090 [Burkholderiaceae bacterium]